MAPFRRAPAASIARRVSSAFGPATLSLDPLRMTATVGEDTTPEAPPERVKLRYMPGLDGVRGIWLLPVMLVHAGFIVEIPGPWVAVSGFFTLSGYLITSLLLLEHDRDGGIGLKKFWGRRFRRLLPASLVVVALIALLSGVHPFWPKSQLRGDLDSVLFYVSNWRFIATSHNYGYAFRAAPSPVTHFWSLSLEEQFYLVFPLLMLGLFALRRLRRWLLPAGLMALWLASGLRAVQWYDREGWSAAYYSLDGRFGEIVMGAILAVVLARKSVVGWLDSPSGRRVVTVVSLVCAAGWVYVLFKVKLSSPYIYHGGLMVQSLLSAGVIVGVTRPGPLQRVCSWRPMCWIGARAYLAYMLHFPLFVILSPGRLYAYLPWPKDYGQLRWATFLLGGAVTFVVCGLSYRYFEGPIRAGTRLRGRRFAVVAPVAILVTLLIVHTVPMRGTDEGSIALQAMGKAARERAARERAIWDAASTRILLFGDSLSFVVGEGLRVYAKDKSVVAFPFPNAGCGVLDDGHADYLGMSGDLADSCPDIVKDIRSEVGEYRPTSVVLMTSGRDLSDIDFPDGTTGHIGEPAFDRVLRRRLDQVVDALAATRVPAVWLLEPHMRANGGSEIPWQEFPENDPARMDRLNAMIRAAVGAAPSGASIKVVDLGAYARRHAGGEFASSFRPDGAHFSRSGALDVAAWLLPQLVDLQDRAAEVHPSGAPGASGSSVPADGSGPAPPAPSTTVDAPAPHIGVRAP